MDSSVLELDEVLQAELVKRVMALEGREETLRVNNAKLTTTIEALDECTGVSRDNIVEIARELSRAATSASGSSQPELFSSLRSLPMAHLAVGSLVVMLSVAMAFKVFMPDAVNSSIDINSITNINAKNSAQGLDSNKIYDSYQQSANLSKSMIDASPLRILVMEYYQYEGEYPESFEVMGYDSKQFVSSNVTGVSLEPNGVIVVNVPEKFGQNKHFKLIPVSEMNGMSINWKCTSNLPASLVHRLQCESV